MKFPMEQDDSLPNDTFIIYNHLVNHHLHLLKLQSKCEFFYLKLAGIFFLLSSFFFLLQNYSFVSPIIEITFIGIVFIFISILKIKKDFEYGIQIADCLKKGLNLENKYNFSSNIFKIHEKNKFFSYRGYLFSRFFSLGFIALVTFISILILFIKINVWIGITVSLFLITILIISSYFYIRRTRKIMLEKAM